MNVGLVKIRSIKLANLRSNVKDVFDSKVDLEEHVVRFHGIMGEK